MNLDIISIMKGLKGFLDYLVTHWETTFILFGISYAVVLAIIALMYFYKDKINFMKMFLAWTFFTVVAFFFLCMYWYTFVKFA